MVVPELKCALQRMTTERRGAARRDVERDDAGLAACEMRCRGKGFTAKAMTAAALRIASRERARGTENPRRTIHGGRLTRKR